LPQLVGDGVRFAMGEENPDPRDRTIAGIAGQDDEYYAGDQRDSAEYEPISGGTVRSHSSPLLDLLFVWSDCWRVRCDSGVCLVIMRAKGALRTPRTAQTVDRWEIAVGEVKVLMKRTGARRRRPYAPVLAVATTTTTTSGEIEKRATPVGKSAKKESEEWKLGSTLVARTRIGCWALKIAKLTAQLTRETKDGCQWTNDLWLLRHTIKQYATVLSATVDSNFLRV
jgi:hypothetical protein